MVGVAVARELEALQDRMAPFPREVAVEVIERAFAKPLDQIFAEFSEPVAAASVAQVHRAKIVADGQERWVAVKVLRPRIERRFRRDLADMFFAARVVHKYSAEARRLKPVEVVETLARSMKMEMDFRLEAAAASEYADNTHGDDDFLVPKVDWDLCAREVLTLEWIDGTPLSDVEALRRSGVDLPKLGRTIIQSFLRHAVRDGFFHADMHQGNLFLTKEGRLAAVDFGIMGRLGMKERRFLAEILYGFITRNYQRVAEVHFEAGYVPPSYRGRRFRSGDPRRGRADPFATSRRHLDGEAVVAAVRDHRAVRHADPHRTGDAAKDHGGGRGRGAVARSEAGHVVHGGAGRTRLDRGKSRPTGQARRCGAGACRGGAARRAGAGDPFARRAHLGTTGNLDNPGLDLWRRPPWRLWRGPMRRETGFGATALRSCWSWSPSTSGAEVFFRCMRKPRPSC